jgi:hypothetical protein
MARSFFSDLERRPFAIGTFGDDGLVFVFSPSDDGFLANNTALVAELCTAPPEVSTVRVWGANRFEQLFTTSIYTL